jgi:hypothetical protein
MSSSVGGSVRQQKVGWPCGAVPGRSVRGGDAVLPGVRKVTISENIKKARASLQGWPADMPDVK